MTRHTFLQQEHSPILRKTGRQRDTDPSRGEVTFSGVKLLTSPGRVMTPRPASEQLVATASSHLGGRVSRAVDVGTGGGAIAIAIAAACPQAEIWATDTSAVAVALARANVRRHQLGRRVFVRQGDLLEPVAGRFDVIAANLPYMPASAVADHPELDDEPFDAVFVPGDGLDAYRRLVAAAAARLTHDGILLLQLDGRVLAAGRGELPALQAALATSWPATYRGTSAFDASAAKAA